MKKYLIFIFLGTFFIACSSFKFQNYRLPKNILTSLDFKLRSLASSDSEAYLSLSPKKKLEHIENVLMPLISKEENFTIKKDQGSFSVTDIIGSKEQGNHLKPDDDGIKRDPQSLLGHLYRAIKQTFIVKYELLWLIKQESDRLGSYQYSPDVFDGSDNFPTKKSSIVKMQEQYLGILGGIHYLYALVAHVYDEKGMHEYDFDYQSLKGLDLVTSRIYMPFLGDQTGVNMKRLTLPAHVTSFSDDVKSSLNESLSSVFKEFGSDGNKVLRNHFEEFKNHYLKYGDEYSERIKSIKLVNADYIPDLVSYTVGAEEKFLMEYLVLKRPKTAQQLAKINLLLGTREMIANAWGVNRLVEGPKRESIKECGKKLLSFKLWNTGKGTLDIDYSKSLWKNDFYVNNSDDLADAVSDIMYGKHLLGSNTLKAPEKISMENLVDQINGGSSSKYSYTKSEKISDEEWKEFRLSSATEYYQILTELVMFPDEFKGKVPVRLTKILEDSYFQEMRDSDDPVQYLTTEFPPEHIVTEEEKSLRIERLAFIKSFFSRDNLNVESLAAQFALESYSIRKSKILRYFMDVLTGDLDIVKVEKDVYQITRADSRKIQNYLSKVIDQRFGIAWLQNTYEIFYGIFLPYKKNIYQNNYKRKLDHLYDFMTDNVRKAILSKKFFAEQKKYKSSSLKYIKEKANRSLPKDYVLALTQFTNIISVISRSGAYLNTYGEKAIDMKFFSGENSFGSKILSDISNRLLEKFKNSNYIQAQILENLQDINQVELSNELWSIFKETMIELKSKYPYSVEKYKKNYHRITTYQMFKGERIPDYVVDILNLEENLKKQFCEEGDASPDCIETCSSYDECVDEMEKPDLKAGTYVDDYLVNTFFSDGLIFYHIAQKFNFLDFNPNKSNQFMEHEPVQETLVDIFIENLVNIEPFFKSKFTVETSFRGKHTTHTTSKEYNFLEVLTKHVLTHQKIPDKKVFKSMYDQVINHADYLENDKLLKDFCLADYRNYDDDPHFKKVFKKTKHIREVIVQNGQKEAADASDEILRGVDPLRYYYQKWLPFIAMGFFAILIVGGALAFVKVTFVMGILQNFLILKFMGIFFLCVGVYEINYALIQLPSERNIQKRLLSARNLKASKNLKLEKVIDIDSYERIKTEASQARFDAIMAAMFIIPDIMFVKHLISRAQRMQRGVFQRELAGRVSSSNRVKQEVVQYNLRRQHMTKLQRFKDDFRKLYRFSHKTTLKATKNDIANMTFDAVKYNLKNSKVAYDTLEGIKHLPQESQNLVSFLMDMNHRIDLSIIKKIKGWNPLTPTRLSKLVDKGNSFLKNIKNANLSDETLLLVDELGRTLKAFEKIRLPKNKIVKLKNIGDNLESYPEEFSEAMRQYLETLNKIEASAPQLSRQVSKIKEMSNQELIMNLTSLKKKQGELIDNLINGKLSDYSAVYDSWLTNVNKLGTPLKKEVDDLILRKDFKEYIFEMYFESRWKAYKYGRLGRKPPSFLESIHRDLDVAREFKETVISKYRSSTRQKASNFSFAVTARLYKWLYTFSKSKKAIVNEAIKRRAAQAI